MVSKTASSLALMASPNSRVKWSLKLHFRLRSYLLRILSVYYRRLLFFCWGKMLSKTAPCFALVVTGTSSKFLACITVIFFFCLGKMVTLIALSVALVIAGTYIESLPLTHVFFSFKHFVRPCLGLNCLTLLSYYGMKFELVYKATIPL